MGRDAPALLRLRGRRVLGRRPQPPQRRQPRRPRRTRAFPPAGRHADDRAEHPDRLLGHLGRAPASGRPLRSAHARHRRRLRVLQREPHRRDRQDDPRAAVGHAVGLRRRGPCPGLATRSAFRIRLRPPQHARGHRRLRRHQHRALRPHVGHRVLRAARRVGARQAVDAPGPGRVQDPARPLPARRAASSAPWPRARRSRRVAPRDVLRGRSRQRRRAADRRPERVGRRRRRGHQLLRDDPRAGGPQLQLQHLPELVVGRQRGDRARKRALWQGRWYAQRPGLPHRRAQPARARGARSDLLLIVSSP